jgi:hypothetical protein
MFDACSDTVFPEGEPKKAVGTEKASGAQLRRLVSPHEYTTSGELWQRCVCRLYEPTAATVHNYLIDERIE